MGLPKGATKRKRSRPSVLEGFLFPDTLCDFTSFQLHPGDCSGVHRRATGRPPAIPENGQGEFVSSLPPPTLSRMRLKRRTK